MEERGVGTRKFGAVGYMMLDMTGRRLALNEMNETEWGIFWARGLFPSKEKKQKEGEGTP